jgi:type I restriction-modification system DNA methylase subunit
LYYPNPYNFAIIPVEILGTAYERFLGRTIYLTSRHAVKVEEKPEVRKAGGVFYTPHYVVDYIVRNTVGELVAGKTPKQAAKIKILDPACGSGNFLLGAYQFLLDWHRDYYRKHCKPSKGHKSDPLTPQGELSTVEKKRILLNNIFGVDIDVNAAEMTKLSLLLKCMEGETEASIANTRRLFHERVLPDIDDNILVGNSLVNTDYYGIVPDDEDEKQIKPFNMQKAFAGVFKQGGFNAVIGNPPYVQMSMFHWFNDNQKNYLLQKYSSSMGRINTFGFFIEKGIQVLAPDGKLGVIVPNTVLTQEYYYELRKFILQNTHIEHIVSYEKRVFSGAVVETATLVLAKTKSAAKTITAFCRNHTKEITYTKKRISQKIFEHTHKNSFIVTSAAGDLRMKQNIDSHCSLKFDDISTINQAIALKKNRSALLYKNQRGKNYQPVLDGREISRYCTNWSGRYLRYDLKAIHSCKREDIFLSKEKIFFRRVASSLIGTLDTNRFYALNTLAVINKRENMNIDIRCLLGVFNSRLVNYYYIKFLKSTKNVFSEIQARQVGQIPFPNIDITKKKDKWQHDEIVHSVNKLLLLYQKLPAAANPQTVRQVRDKIAYYEEQIDQIVYQLYGLTDEEIKMIENESGEKDGHKTVHQR